MRLFEKIVGDGITFDDVLIVPARTSIKKTDPTTDVVLHNRLRLKIPIISSPMDTVTGGYMAIAMAQEGGLGILHRGMKHADKVGTVKLVKHQESNLKKSAIDEHGRLVVGVAIGMVGDDEKEYLHQISQLLLAGADCLLIDTAHGDSDYMVKTVEILKTEFPKCILICGNVATASAAKTLIDAGADILRVGIGGGSICTTRIVTGVGVPQLTAIDEVRSAIEESGKPVTLIADGGIRQAGDICKALAVGADAVMLGGMLGGTEETPGETIILDGGTKAKVYRGMGSLDAIAGDGGRYHEGKDKSEIVSEGVVAHVPFKGPVAGILRQLVGSLKSSMFYVGAKDLKEFADAVLLVRASQNSLRESHPSHRSVGIERNYF